jgi:hypothetical protein
MKGRVRKYMISLRILKRFEFVRSLKHMLQRARTVKMRVRAIDMKMKNANL